MSKFHEVWITFKKFEKYLADTVYDVRRDASTEQSYTFLKAYFAEKRNHSGLIRNGFGFHLPHRQLPQMPLRQFEDQDTFDIFLHETRANCLFSMCDFLVFQCMRKDIFGSIDDDKLQNHFDLLLEEDAELHAHVLRFFDAMLAVLFSRELRIDVQQTEHVEVTDAQGLAHLRLFYFIDVGQRSPDGSYDTVSVSA